MGGFLQSGKAFFALGRFGEYAVQFVNAQHLAHRRLQARVASGQRPLDAVAGSADDFFFNFRLLCLDLFVEGEAGFGEQVDDFAGGVHQLFHVCRLCQRRIECCLEGILCRLEVFDLLLGGGKVFVGFQVGIDLGDFGADALRHVVNVAGDDLRADAQDDFGVHDFFPSMSLSMTASIWSLRLVSTWYSSIPRGL